jgi:hypothetical protein
MRRPIERPLSSLHAKLRGLLALSLATPVATFAACRGAGEEGTAVIDASLGPFDASADASRNREAGDAADAADANACTPIPVEAGFFGGDGSCDNFVYLPCGVPSGLEGIRCNPSVDLCTAVCPAGFFFVCDFPPPTCEDGGIASGAPVYLDCTSCIGTNAGRRPVGLLRLRRERRSRRGSRPAPDAGTYFARMASAERASVDAFVQLFARLTRFGAPARLRREALRAAEDEKRHAEVTARLARMHGGELAPARPCPELRLTFEELALENAVEGCVRETFAALVAMHQAAVAKDQRVRSAMRRIAEDETRHAELAWAIHRWAMPRLSEAGRRTVRESQRRTLSELKNGARGTWPAEVVRLAGLPAAAAEVRMLEDFGSALFGFGGRGEGHCPAGSSRRVMTRQ